MPTSKKWTLEETNYLKQNYTILSNIELGKYLDCSTYAINKKLKELNLHRKYGKYTFYDVQNAFKKTKYILLSQEDEYINSGVKNIRYLCPDHLDKGEQLISFGHFKNGEGCKYCGRKIVEQAHIVEFDEEYDQALCESKGFQYIQTIRKDRKIQIEFICSKHEELGSQFMVKYNMKRDIKGCKYCNGRDLPEWYVMKKAKEINPFLIILDPYKKLTDRLHCYCTKHNLPTIKSMQNILDGHGCKECGREKLSQKSFNTFEDVAQRIIDRNPHISLIKYLGASEPCICYCNKHKKEFSKILYNLCNSDSGCDICYTENIRERQALDIEEFKNRLKQIHPELLVVGEYINNSTPIELYCTKHKHFFTLTPAAVLNRKSCCSKSRINYKEEKMCQLLEAWGYNIIRQKQFENCQDKRILLFDAYLCDYNVAIEYQGEQHYYPVKYSSETMEEAVKKLKYTQKHDKIKADFCKENNISLIYVPYWEYEDMEYYLFDQLSKIKVIEELIA